MNKHTLNYHTRLHDWYRQHSILQEKQQQQQHQHHDSVAPKAPPSDAGVGTLTQDKLHFINNWCAEVNKSLFRVKKKESPPLFRRCRLSANSSISGLSKSADPRRIHSAEVFTLSGQSIKEAKASIRGGELLPPRDAKSTKIYDTREAALPGRITPATTGSFEHLDLCVRNSKEGDASGKVLPRVNHDSLNLRSNAWVLKQNGSRVPERTPNSPRCSVSSMHRAPHLNNRLSSTAGRAKSAAPRTSNNRISGNHTTGQNQREIELLENAKNKEYSRKAHTWTSSQRSLLTSKTDETNTETDERGRSFQPVTKVEVTEEVNQMMPNLCSTCLDMHSGKVTHVSTSLTCEPSRSQNLTRTALADLEEAEKRLAKQEKKLDAKLTRTEVDMKDVEHRLTEDSIHYSSERQNLRHVSAKKGVSLPKTFDDLEDDRNISFDSNAADEDTDDNENLPSGRSLESKPSDMSATKSPRGDKAAKRIAKVTILPAEDVPKTNDDTKQCSDTDQNNDKSIDSEEAQPDFNLLQIYNQRRGQRRLSINFSIKPTIGNISVSNNLLHVLSIDDCKVNMRYSPHKVLEEHEVTDKFMMPLDLNASSNFSVGKEGETTSRVAMRISRDSSSVTSLQSSTAKDATRANKKQYRILYDPEDLDFLRNKRPTSASLIKAFNTLVHDRTIMQRLDQVSSTCKTKSKRAVSCTYEGPRYRRVHAALRRHMGEVLQDHCNQLWKKYEHQKTRSTKTKAKPGTPLESHSPSLSLSLDSLPVVKKGILKQPTIKIEQDSSNNSLENKPEN